MRILATEFLTNITKITGIMNDFLEHDTDYEQSSKAMFEMFSY